MAERPVLAASAVVIDDAGRVLLVRRAHDPGRGLWSVPGGRVEPGETLEDACAREVLEETGYAVEVGPELWTAHVPTGDGRDYEIHDFAATVVSGRLVAGDDADEAGWFSLDAMAALPMVEGLLDLLRSARA
ncbi:MULTISPECIES: NUDIX hydrolase [unclassified Aeromicrobium]|uniref:NUDIX hydrolase n=1 Tax=unclassified Aeromicrobium TaxID=2633570 RepID=UPI00396B02F2